MHSDTSLTGKHLVDFLLVKIELFSESVTAEALPAKIDWKLPFFQGVDLLHGKFHIEEDVPHQPFIHRQLGQRMPYNFVADGEVQF